MSDKIKTGNRGEDLACDFFLEMGFEIVARNFRHRKSEIDLIIRKEDWVIFVEVKTRTSNTFGEPEEFVDDRKINKVFEAAEEWIFSNDWKGHVRFDVVSVKLGAEPVIEHFQDAIN